MKFNSQTYLMARVYKPFRFLTFDVIIKYNNKLGEIKIDF